ncbi:hypothetical protein T310_3793 [Rasamsonia emersonii CBS 393.64]|uniref:Uncharacterized protein n=1 Tax=Rasamsonia emersonii (strain ATCC 16479 / CBS 393.64 / IMI 116815) TaxID=1408163 RepID=A0A0F4YV83_RASE3|nr:hypothetical protein T310_3793 [Rasamsonia emersonii CBS 393.64]KKA22182.1 hypothetical protein T310_3793 [Rasamsonia emersonii CBS 393.64]
MVVREGSRSLPDSMSFTSTRRSNRSGSPSSRQRPTWRRALPRTTSHKQRGLAKVHDKGSSDGQMTTTRSEATPTRAIPKYTTTSILVTQVEWIELSATLRSVDPLRNKLNSYIKIYFSKKARSIYLNESKDLIAIRELSFIIIISIRIFRFNITEVRLRLYLTINRDIIELIDTIKYYIIIKISRIGLLKNISLGLALEREEAAIILRTLKGFKIKSRLYIKASLAKSIIVLTKIESIETILVEYELELVDSSVDKRSLVSLETISYKIRSNLTKERFKLDIILIF